MRKKNNIISATIKQGTQTSTPRISIVCYNRIEKWHSRTNALRFFRDCARNTEGAERDRYINIVWDLEDKKTVCHDASSLPYNTLKANNLYYTTIAPDGSRDYGNKVWYAKD